MAKDNSTGKTKGFYERGQAIFDRIPGMPEDEVKSKQVPTLIDTVLKHEQQIQELKQLVTPMMEFKRPTKIFGPNLVGILNSAGFYRKKEWVGLTDEEIKKCIASTIKVTDHLLLDAVQAVVIDVESKLKEKNGG